MQFIDGDTDRVAFGMGSNGSRSMVAGGSALTLAADKVIEKGKRIAAHLLEAASRTSSFAEGEFSVAGTDRDGDAEAGGDGLVPAGAVAARDGAGLNEHATYVPRTRHLSNGCHVCEVEIDPETGAVQLVAYLVVDDVGTVINPLDLAGQIHGGVAQGVGQILMEQVVYDQGSGQLLTASFMDYAMPRADTMCRWRSRATRCRPRTTRWAPRARARPGRVGALPAVMIAIMNALAPLGVRELDMPATSERVWQAIQGKSKEGRDAQAHDAAHHADGAEYREALRDGRRSGWSARG